MNPYGLPRQLRGWPLLGCSFAFVCGGLWQGQVLFYKFVLDLYLLLSTICGWQWLRPLRRLLHLRGLGLRGWQQWQLGRCGWCIGCRGYRLCLALEWGCRCVDGSEIHCKPDILLCSVCAHVLPINSVCMRACSVISYPACRIGSSVQLGAFVVMYPHALPLLWDTC